MDPLLVLLSVLTLPYGVIFSSNELKIVKYSGLAYFVVSVVCECYYAFKNWTRLSTIEWVGYEAFYSGVIVYGYTLLRNRNFIVDYVRSNIHLLDKSNRKKIIALLIFVISHGLLELSMYINDQGVKVWQHFSADQPFNQSDYVQLSQTIFVIHYFWDMFSPVLYGLMFFLMHLRHKKFLEHLTGSKNHPHGLVYTVLVRIKADHEHFDNVMSLIPAIWLINMILGISAVVGGFASMNPFLAALSVLEEFVYFPAVFIFINRSYYNLSKKVSQLKQQIAVNRTTDQPCLTLSLLDQMSSVCVTAGSLVNLDKNLVLPVIGTVFTYTFLFREKFL